MKNKFAIIALVLSSITQFGCYHASEFVYHDSLIKMHEYEIVDLIQNKKGRKLKKKTIENQISLENIYEPEEPKVIEDKIVSVNVSEDVPIVDVIMELSRMSGIDVQIDPTIIGGVNLSLKNKPLRYVFNRICGLTDTRYEEKYGILVFTRDMPYAKTYDIDFLDVNRSTSSSITLNTSGLSTSATIKGGGTSTVTTKSDDTFWSDIVKDIEQIIDTTENTNSIYTSTAEKIQRIAQNEEAENRMQEDINNGVYNKMVSEKNKNQNNEKANPLVSISVSKNRIRVNKRAGIIIITASTKSHRLIEKYLQKLKKKSTAQVLIEMRFLVINLNKQYQSGIDWGNIKLGQLASSSIKLVPELTQGSVLPTLTFNKGIDFVASLFEKFGSTRTLSNPRINAMNNQPALMTFATNYVYFKSKAMYTPATYNNEKVIVTPAYRNVDTEAQTMPLGIIMSVLPSIDIEKHQVMLNIKPTISKLEETVSDPAVTILMDEQLENGKKTSSDKVLSTKSSIPVANIRELDTILKLKDGQTAVIGGFTERSASSINEGVPFLRSIPIIGNFFGRKNNKSNSTETIILVRATIVDYGKEVSEYEYNIFDKMSDDPRYNEI